MPTGAAGITTVATRASTYDDVHMNQATGGWVSLVMRVGPCLRVCRRMTVALAALRRQQSQYLERGEFRLAGSSLASSSLAVLVDASNVR